MGICSVRRPWLLLGTHLLSNIPGILIDDSFVGIREYHQFIRGGSSALFRLEILADRLAQHSMTKIFLSVEDIANSSGTPSVRISYFFMPAIFRMGLIGIGRRDQYFFLCQRFGNNGSALALASHTEDFSDYFSGRFIYIQLLLIVLSSYISVGDRATAPHACFHSGPEHCLDFIARVLCIPLIHDIQEWGKVIFCRIGTVNAVVDSDKAHSLFREHHFCVVTDLQIITTKTT
ncbi:hypothetical protein EVA_20553 [gut metagenome]|uniref:Uncharacterized protein n=1 Tax=gut metagenome TaxID=749906 RepID=J9FP24_9ZZZZ